MADSPTGPALPTPMSLRYARALLFLQAGCWGLMSLVAVYWALSSKSAAPGGIPLWHHPAWDFGVAGVTVALAGAKAWLAVRMSRRSRGTRRTAIVVEFLMVGFAVAVCLQTANLDGGFIPFCAGFAGGIMSLVAAMWLTRPPATQYVAGLRGDITPANTTSQPDDSQDLRFTSHARQWSCMPGC